MTSTSGKPEFDVLVVGAGHAGCEAAYAASRLGLETCLMTTHLDAFAMGALAAIFPIKSSSWRILISFALLISVGVLVMLTNGNMTVSALGYPLGLQHGYAYLWGYTLLNIFSVLVISALTTRTFLPRFFEWRPLRYVGEISYGVYILHYPVQSMIAKAMPSFPSALRLSIQIIITLILASISYRFLELPFLRLKEKWFPPPQKGLQP